MEPEQIAQSQKNEVLNIRAEALSRRSPLHHTLSLVARVLSNPWFFLAELLFHVGWVLLNSGAIAGVAAWDPYPFSLLTGVASVQALFIGLLILMYAEHEATIADVRQEMELQVALHSERETSKVLRMLTDVHHQLNIRSPEQDEELALMSQPLDPRHLRESTERHIEEAEHGEP